MSSAKRRKSWRRPSSECSKSCEGWRNFRVIMSEVLGSGVLHLTSTDDHSENGWWAGPGLPRGDRRNGQGVDQGDRRLQPCSGY